MAAKSPKSSRKRSILSSPTNDPATVTFTDLVITSVSTGGSGGEDDVTETVTLDFGSFKTDYQPQSEEGPNGPPVDYGWKADKKS